MPYFTMSNPNNRLLVRVAPQQPRAAAPKNKPKKKKQRQQQSNNGMMRIEAPAAVGSINRNPVALYNGKKTVLVTNTEYITPVLGQASIVVNGISSQATIGINPCNQMIFPWLVNIASCFEEYRFKKLKFHFKSFSASSSPGKVTLAIDYDAADAVPTTYQELAVNEDYVDCNIWHDCTLTSKAANRDLNTRWRYCRPGLQPADTDIKTYDLGQLIVCTGSCASTVTIGDLWVEYECELRIPSGNSPITAQSFHTNRTGGTGSSPYVANLVGQTINTLIGNIITYPTTAPTRQIQINAIGQYLVDTVILGTTLVPTSATAAGGCTIQEQGFDVNATATSITAWFRVLVLALPAIVTLPISSYATFTSMDINAGPIGKNII